MHAQSSPHKTPWRLLVSHQFFVATRACMAAFSSQFAGVTNSCHHRMAGCLPTCCCCLFDGSPVFQQGTWVKDKEGAQDQEEEEFESEESSSQPHHATHLIQCLAKQTRITRVLVMNWQCGLHTLRRIPIAKSMMARSQTFCGKQLWDMEWMFWSFATAEP